MTLVAWIYPEISKGPLINYKVQDRGVHIWLESPNRLVAKFEMRDSSQPYAIQSDKIRLKAWNYVAASYDYLAGTAGLWIDGKEVSRLNLGRFEISTQDDVRVGAVKGDPNFYKGAIACVQIYNKSLSEQEINDVKDRCPLEVQMHHIGCYADKLSSPAIPSMEGKDVLLDGEPKTREDIKQKCARVALKNGHGYFAIQDGGSCLSSLTAQETYGKYGLSTDCQDGKGSLMASDVYEVVMFSDQTCWNGWEAVGDSCFRLNNDKKTWDEAQAVCRTEKATLAKLDSEEESYFVFLNLIRPTNPSSSVWIGLSRDAEKKYHWSDGSLVGYTNWGPNLPDTSPGNRKNCTKINEFSGLWENEEFDLNHPFLCGRVIPPAPRDIYVKLMDSHSALVSWSTSTHPRQDDLMTSFYVEYKVTNDEQMLLKVVRNHNSTSLSGLKSHAEYQIRVRAVNGAGGGFWSQYYTFSTGKTYPPRILPIASVRAKVPREPLALNCAAKGGPEPTINWYKNRNVIHKGQTLIVANMTSEGQDVYTCRASNGIEPDDVESVTVISLVPPVLNQMWVTGTEGEISIKKGDHLSLHCETANTTFGDITWHKDGEPLHGQRSKSQNILNIPEVSGDDFGVYECKAQNALGSTSMKMRVSNADDLNQLKVAVGCLAGLSAVLVIVTGLLGLLLYKARKTIEASQEENEQDEEPPIKPPGPRPSDSDFMIPEVRSAGLPGMAGSHGSDSSYTPLKLGLSNGGTFQTYKA
ncbi:uncharacterized protein LOC111343028 [Stylophora pistillata]|nr:uncharacterized protein LOC111343028 [Stylophora pistillata]